MENNPSAIITRTKPQLTLFILSNLQNLLISPLSQQPLTDLQKIKESLLIYCLSKSQMSTSHKFSFISSSTTSISFSSDLDQIRENIRKINISESDLPIYSLLSQLFSEYDITPDKEYNYVIQIILIIGENPLEKAIFHEFLSHKDIFFDILYLPESEEINEKFLNETQRMLIEECKNKCYYYNLKRDQNEIYRRISLLTAHPQQRIPQNEIENYLLKFSNTRRR